MKKSLIALAVLAASGAAMAQSSVTLYGRVDASLGTTKNTVTDVSTTKLFNGSDAGLTGSRWGMKGTEDLGGGLNAVFVLENRFNVDEGTSAGQFLGDAYVGLTGGFGTVHLGRTYSVFDSAKAVSVASNVFDSSFTAYASPAYEVRGANQIKYVSPSFSGFSVAASVALKESNVAGAENTNSLGLFYAAGPLKAALAMQTREIGDNAVVSVDYNFGVASVSAGYSDFDGNGANVDASGWSIGATMPMGAMKFSVGYAEGETEGAAPTDKTSFGLGATYSLSKRTTLYVGYNDRKTETTAGVKTVGTRLYAAGVRHDF
ncbi:MAG: porin [Rhodoferax sp.]|uniref:porin n=1 Tax=Rhodoferax sp. TaxID=50421 RepID=UPI0027300119|nr:porin [Rhodoferax sp.]MDP1528307.1 porin [Rhodoferax sp.]MDP1945575.1 porin [Rhodoferax sp.]